MAPNVELSLHNILYQYLLIFTSYINTFHIIHAICIIDFYSNLKCSFLFKQQTLWFNLKISLFGFLIIYLKEKLK